MARSAVRNTDLKDLVAEHARNKQNGYYDIGIEEKAHRLMQLAYADTGQMFKGLCIGISFARASGRNINLLDQAAEALAEIGFATSRFAVRLFPSSEVDENLGAVLGDALATENGKKYIAPKLKTRLGEFAATDAAAARQLLASVATYSFLPDAAATELRGIIEAHAGSLSDAEALSFMLDLGKAAGPSMNSGVKNTVATEISHDGKFGFIVQSPADRGENTSFYRYACQQAWLAYERVKKAEPDKLESLIDTLLPRYAMIPSHAATSRMTDEDKKAWAVATTPRLGSRDEGTAKLVTLMYIDGVLLPGDGPHPKPPKAQRPYLKNLKHFLA
jgi:hypothetical protein